MKFSEYEALAARGQSLHVDEASVPREARPFQGHRAGAVTRGLAALIDLGLVVVTVIIINACAAILRFIIVRTAGMEIPHIQWSIVLGAALLWATRAAAAPFMAAAAAYVAMIFCAWSLAVARGAAPAPTPSVDVGWAPFAVKFTNLIVTGLVYCFAMVAPALFPDRDFS